MLGLKTRPLSKSNIVGSGEWDSLRSEKGLFLAAAQLAGLCLSRFTRAADAWRYAARKLVEDHNNNNCVSGHALSGG
jgi:hypothetical protein